MCCLILLTNAPNLHTISGDFYKKPKEDVLQGERAKPVKYGDNLKPEGDFYDRPQKQAPLKGERADIKKPVDNLKPEGIVCWHKVNVNSDVDV